jgi:hydroxyacylglutathione hydrolase
MIKIQTFVFNAFQVNCYVLWDETGECLILDACCLGESEQNRLSSFITANNLKPKISVYTHCHTDHVVAAAYLKEQYGLLPVIHRAGLPILATAAASGRVYGMIYPEPPQPESFVDEGVSVDFGQSSLKVLYTPGHVDGSICLHEENQRLLFTGDVLFRQSIGRTDLPTGDYDTLIGNIASKLMILPDDTRVFPGHGPETSIGFERIYNPFL